MDYKTVEAYAFDDFVEKKSRFIGHIAPVTTKSDAVAFIDKISKQYADATHNVSAYVLREGQTEHYNDNGEPSGTAGIPVLDVIKKSQLVDVCIVATRYFGGILLGGGGLVRAYSHSATIAINKAKVNIMTICCDVLLKCEYQLYGKLSYIFPQYGITVLDSVFAEDVTIKLTIKEDGFNEFEKAITELSNGKASLVIISSRFAAAN